jgi:hypothetical protein
MLSLQVLICLWSCLVVRLIDTHWCWNGICRFDRGNGCADKEAVFVSTQRICTVLPEPTSYALAGLSGCLACMLR